MKHEYEAKFLHSKPGNVRRLMKQNKASCKSGKHLQRRVVYDIPGKSGWLRLRDEGQGIVTLAYKEVRDAKSIHGTYETEIKVSNFETTRTILTILGLDEKSYQENYREAWLLHDAEITLDSWPGIDPFVEIEAKNPKIVSNIAKLLGFSMNNAFFGSVDTVYEEAGLSIKGIAKLTFKNTT